MALRPLIPLGKFPSSPGEYAGANCSVFDMNLYHRIADKTMDSLTQSLEELLDESGQATYDVEYSSGVLTLKLGQHGTYVINKQPPNKQIWLSSPTSGPKRYDWKGKQWTYSRDNSTLQGLLNTELGHIFQKKLQLLNDEDYDLTKDF